MKPPPDEWRVTVWSAWVISGADRGERQSRLEQCPAVSRDAVRQEVVWYFERLGRKK